MQLKRRIPSGTVLCHIEGCRLPYEVTFHPFPRVFEPLEVVRLCDEHGRALWALERERHARELAAQQEAAVDTANQGEETGPA